MTPLDTFAHATVILGFTSIALMFVGAFTRSFASTLLGILTGFGFLLGLITLIHFAR